MNEEKTVTYTVCVPVCVEKEVQVQVCQMVPKKIMVAQPASGHSAPALSSR